MDKRDEVIQIADKHFFIRDYRFRDYIFNEKQLCCQKKKQRYFS